MRVLPSALPPENRSVWAEDRRRAASRLYERSLDRHRPGPASRGAADRRLQLRMADSRETAPGARASSHEDSSSGSVTTYMPPLEKTAGLAKRRNLEARSGSRSSTSRTDERVEERQRKRDRLADPHRLSRHRLRAVVKRSARSRTHSPSSCSCPSPVWGISAVRIDESCVDFSRVRWLIL